MIDLVDHLPKERILLSIFSSMFTGDPHYLDLDSKHCVLFLYALSYIEKISFPESREDKVQLLSKYLIDVDNLSNFVITYGLLSDREYMNCFSEALESLLLNTQNILGSAWFNTKDKKVFIFENPSILMEIIDRKIKANVVISGGFSNSSDYLLLDKLVEKGNRLFYNGDFEPEGLLIAQMLKIRYKDHLQFICYDKVDYVACGVRSRLAR